MEIVDVVIGFMLLLAGRPAYWFFVGGISYLVGSYYARLHIAFFWSWGNLLLALVFTLAGITLAYSFNRWAARIAVFISGAYLLYRIPNLLTGQAEIKSLILLAVAGAAAVLIVSISFDMGMAIISALVGATMILSNIRTANLDQKVSFLLLVIISVIAQYLVMLLFKPSPD